MKRTYDSRICETVVVAKDDMNAYMRDGLHLSGKGAAFFCSSSVPSSFVHWVVFVT